MGGGIYNGNSNPQIMNCTFETNTGGWDGGGIYGGSGAVSHCTFTNNLGGGIKAWGALSYCTFMGNEAWEGGGAEVSGPISHCIFSGNTGNEGGGCGCLLSKLRGVRDRTGRHVGSQSSPKVRLFSRERSGLRSSSSGDENASRAIVVSLRASPRRSRHRADANST